jgi:cob(I)alamin adenosyltransferase
MVVLNKIYTKTGDKGSTSLGDGSRISKDALRVETYGTIDEANSVIGIVRTYTKTSELITLDTFLGSIQNELFDLGAELSTPKSNQPNSLSIVEKQVDNRARN